MSEGWQAALSLASPILALLGVLGGAQIARRAAQRDVPVVTQIANLRADNTVLRVEVRVLEDYVHQLRDHIADGKGAPPPPWPEELRQQR